MSVARIAGRFFSALTAHSIRCSLLIVNYSRQFKHLSRWATVGEPALRALRFRPTRTERREKRERSFDRVGVAAERLRERADLEL